ncbi:MAG: hypothetical protein PWP15_1144 [Methanothermococcus sp.]|jgi:hypothetical protein|uniref:hypothetical protein n=1 Tax=Methanothermococcus sp. TaxID=2614238 RepID=UPI00258DA491|nr:hypothetical protein [Methanothermococcus sp.]MDK2790637.1 hypothetical protein [Methanothermococcus sp.]
MDNKTKHLLNFLKRYYPRYEVQYEEEKSEFNLYLNGLKLVPVSYQKAETMFFENLIELDLISTTIYIEKGEKR